MQTKSISILATSLVAVLALCVTGCSQSEPNQQAQGGTAQASVGDLTLLTNGNLTRADGSAVEASELEGKTVLLYFSAHWCPPCRAFTPQLVKAYDQWKADDKPVELVFVSFDRGAAEMKSYMTETSMKWLAIPFGEEARRQGLAEIWGVRGIPSLVVLSPDRKTITKNGVDAVRKQAAAALDAWL